MTDAIDGYEDTRHRGKRKARAALPYVPPFSRHRPYANTEHWCAFALFEFRWHGLTRWYREKSPLALKAREAYERSEIERRAAERD